MASSATARKLIAALSLLTAAPAVSFVSSTRAIRSFSSRSGSGGTFRSSTVRASPGMLLDGLLGGRKYDPPCVMGEEEIMSPKEHGTSKVPVQENLRWGCDGTVADRICNFNRHYAEYAGYWEATNFLASKESMEAIASGTAIDFYDSNTGKMLFTAPKGRTMEEFVAESKSHGWPSFRDEEVNWDLVRVLKDGETVSVDGTHLGHNLPDGSGNRYCINLVSVAGRKVE